jgi:hypothetical protein
LIALAKRALPVLGGFYGTKLIASKVGSMLPASLGTAATPVSAAITVAGLNFATNRFAPLRKYRSEIMLGSMLGFLDAAFSAFAPASLKTMIGVGDVYDRALSEYVGTGEYVGVGEFLDDDIAMNNYIAVGAQEELGVDEALGLEQELGVDEALGASWDYGGLPGGIGGSPSPAMNAAIAPRAFAQQVPQRSFAKPVATVSGEFDNPSQLYVGSFSGGFGN